MSLISAFCMLGGHSVVMEDDGGPLSNRLPEGWRLVRASVVPAPTGPDDPWEPGIWYIDPDSPASIIACPDHQPIDIRKEG